MRVVEQRHWPKILLAAAAIGALAACAGDESGGRREFGRLVPGDPAPDFAAATLNGDTVSLASLRGSPVMLNIWATWCFPCRDEMPGLEALHREYSDDGLRVVGVSIDASGARQAVDFFLDEFDVTFTILHDPSERVTRAFRSMGVPETYLIDRDGIIAHRWIGKFDPQAEGTIERVREALKDAG